MTDSPGVPESSAASEPLDASTGGEVSIQRIQVLNLVVLALGAGVGCLLSVRFALGVLAGGVLMGANFRIIAGVVRSVFLKQSVTAVNAGLYWVKFLAVMALVGAFMLWFRIDVFGFLVGLSTILVAVTLEAVLRLAGR